jgi:hypothetical protein
MRLRVRRTITVVATATANRKAHDSPGLPFKAAIIVSECISIHRLRYSLAGVVSRRGRDAG